MSTSNNQQNDPLYQQARRAAQQQVNNVDPLAANPNNNSSNQPPRQLQLNDSNIMSNRSSSPNASHNNNNKNTSNSNMQQTTLKPTPSEPPIALQTVLNNKLPPIGSNGTKININGGIYPLPINTNFVPGGLIYKPSSLVSKLSNTLTDEVEENGMVYLSEYSTSSGIADKNKPNSSPKNTSSSNRRRSRGLSIDTDVKGSNNKGTKGPQDVIHKALAADVTLHKYALLYAQQQPSTSPNSANNTPKVGQRLPSLSG